MTQNRCFIPDPPPSEHAQAPPTHAHSNLPADEGVWAAARRSYVDGCSTPVVAERHGLNERTVRRRAAAEDWPALRRAHLLQLHREGLLDRGAPPFAGEPMSVEEAFTREPELAAVMDANGWEVGELLLNPEPDRLSRFAFRRAAEAAARGAAAEAGSWMRLVQAVDRTAARLNRLSRPFGEADWLRARHADTLRRTVEARDDEGGRGKGEREEGERGEPGPCPPGPRQPGPCPDVRDVRVVR